MTVSTAFAGSRSVFLDTAPAVYALSEASPFNAPARRAVTHCVSSGLVVLTSPVTLAECLAGEDDLLRQLLFQKYLAAQEIRMVGIGAEAAEITGSLRRTTKLKLADSLQLATALVAGCDTFLTNDAQLAKASVALRFVLVSDLDP